MEMMKNAYGSYVKFTDEEVMACRTDKKMLEMLVENSVAFVTDIVVSYYIGKEYTREDKIQIGFEGFLKAVKNFDPQRHAGFYTFAHYSVNSELNNVRKGMRRAKRGWDNENNSQAFVASLDVAVGDEDDTLVIDTIADDTVDMESGLMNIMDSVSQFKKFLNDNQFTVFVEYYINGKTLQQIAEITGRKKESVGRTAKEVAKVLRTRYTEAQFAEIIGLR
jgi:RNA polymerase sigma factor (sigma-70 family)